MNIVTYFPTKNIICTRNLVQNNIHQYSCLSLVYTTLTQNISKYSLQSWQYSVWSFDNDLNTETRYIDDFQNMHRT